jgi:hypothetical protein
VQEMKVWPFGVALRGETSNRLKLRWLKTVVVSVGGKGARDVSGRDREGERERTVADASKQEDDIKTGAVKRARDEPGGCPSIGQAVSGVEAARVRSAASAWNVGRRTLTLSSRAVSGAARGSAPSGRNREALSTVAAPADGPARSSGEASVTGVE